MTTEQFAYQERIKTLEANNAFLAQALEELTERDRNNTELISILRDENKMLRIEITHV